MPWALQSAYGGKRFYTYAQVAKCQESLKLAPDLRAIGAAAYCSRDEFVRKAPGGSELSFREMRDELCDLFDFDDRDLNAEGIRKRRIKQGWNPSNQFHDGPNSGAGRPGDAD